MQFDTAVPGHVGDSEKIIRLIFSPINLKKNKPELRANAFKAPSNENCLSIIRLDYCDENFCRDKGKEYQNTEKLRQYFGLGLLAAGSIRTIGPDVVASPIKDHSEYSDNPFHGDIQFSTIDTDEDSARQQEIADELVRICKLFPDPNLESEIWEGAEVQ